MTNASSKSILHDATPSWNGYNYQGKVGLYVSLTNIIKEARIGIGLPTFDTFLDEHHIEYEWIEDFAIKRGDEYLSLHQVKHKGENKFKDHVEAIATILYRKKGILPDTDIFKYFNFRSKKEGDTATAKEKLKIEISTHKLIDEKGLLNSNWRDNVKFVDIKYRSNIIKCFTDFEALSQKAFRTSTTYFHTADEVAPPLENITNIAGIPSHLVPNLAKPKSLSCQKVFLSFDKPTVYNLALSDDALNSELDTLIKELLALLHIGTTFLDTDIKLYKTALCSLVDQNLMLRHQHIRDKKDHHIPYLQTTKPSISFQVIVQKLKSTYRDQDDSYWNLVCRENFEKAYKEQIEDTHKLLANSVIDDKKYQYYMVRLESVRQNVIQHYFPDDCAGFLRRIYPHVYQGPSKQQYYSQISEPNKIKSVFFNFIKKVEKPSGKLTLKCKKKVFEYQPSCINFNEADPEVKYIEIERAKKGLVDNQGDKSNVFTNVDYIVVNSTGENDEILAGIEKITEVESYDENSLGTKESDKITQQKEISFIDSRKALGEING